MPLFLPDIFHSKSPDIVQVFWKVGRPGDDDHKQAGHPGDVDGLGDDDHKQAGHPGCRA